MTPCTGLTLSGTLLQKFRLKFSKLLNSKKNFELKKVTEKNQKWRQEMLAEKFQRDFAHEMINILTSE